MISRKTVRFSNRQQNITSAGDIYRNGQGVRIQMRCSFPNGLPAPFLTGQTTAAVANVVSNIFRIIASA